MLFLALSASSLACAEQVHLAADPNSRFRPNVAIIVADDLGWNDVSYHGSAVQTPNIDALASDGIRLERFYVSPICSPTRAALLTGRTPIHFGAQYTNATMPGRELTIAERLSRAGYQTSAIGKWHLGSSHSDLHPLLQGFDSFYGMIGGQVDFYSHRFWTMLDWQRNGVPIWSLRYSTDLLGEEAVRFVKGRDPGRPFFLYLSFNAPHAPNQAPAEVVARYMDAGLCPEDEFRCYFAAQVEVMDVWIGRFMEALREEGIAEDTLVIFMTDNGADLRFGGSNLPLRAGKNRLFEGGIRVPAIACWPGKLRAGIVVSQYMRDTDLFATIEAAAEYRISAPSESVNMWPVLTGAPEFERAPMFFAVDTQGQFEGEGTVQHAVIENGIKLLRRDFDRAGHELLMFDLEADPEERHNLAAEQLFEARRLDLMVRTWARNQPDDGARALEALPFPTGLPASATNLMEDRKRLLEVARAKSGQN